MEITWLGHGSWSLKIGGVTVLLDPFLDENPAAPCKAAEVTADFILVSHGHFDHIADVAPIANRCGATVVTNYEIAEWLKSQHQVENCVGMNLGGSISLPFGKVTMTLAWHSSQLPDGSYGGNPGGFVVEADKRVYFACDTALFSDMSLLASPTLDLAVLPIGDLFTMGPNDALKAIEFLRPKEVAPAHFNTWPPIEQNADDWAARVRAETTAQPRLFVPGEPQTLG